MSTYQERLLKSQVKDLFRELGPCQGCKGNQRGPAKNCRICKRRVCGHCMGRSVIIGGGMVFCCSGSCINETPFCFFK
jgi:hypothetical protein